MKKTALLLVAAIIAASCTKVYHKPNVQLLTAYPFPSHNNYVDAYYNPDKFPDQRNFVKVAVIHSVSHSSEMENQIAILKSVAQQYGADGILILGINESGANTARKANLGKDVLELVSTSKEVDFYTNQSDNEIVALAIKYRKNLDIVNQSVKNMVMYKYDTTSRTFKEVETYRFSFDHQILSGDTKNPDFIGLKGYANFFLVFDKSASWKEILREKNLIVREYSKFRSPRMISSTSINNDGEIEKIVKLYPRTKQQEVIKYQYNGKKPLGRTIVKADSTIYEEQFTTNKQNKVEEVLVYNKTKQKKLPLFKLTYSYYTTKDADSLIVMKKNN